VCVKASLPSSQCPTEKENADLLTERKKERKKKLIQYPDNVVSRPFSHIFGEYGIIRMAGRRHSVEKSREIPLSVHHKIQQVKNKSIML
jgi:hypothetical protein